MNLICKIECINKNTEITMETTQFSINRSLCEIKFIDTDMKNIDIDIFEYIWFKIRDTYKKPTDSFTIKFTELTKNIGKYQKQNSSLKKSIERMERITIKTNMKSGENQKRFTFKFSLFRVKDKVYYPKKSRQRFLNLNSLHHL